MDDSQLKQSFLQMDERLRDLAPVGTVESSSKIVDPSGFTGFVCFCFVFFLAFVQKKKIREK